MDGKQLVFTLLTSSSLDETQNSFQSLFTNSHQKLNAHRFGFNAGSTGCMYGCMDIAAQAAVNTTLSMAAGGMSCLFISIMLGNPGDIGSLLNGMFCSANQYMQKQIQYNNLN